MNFRNLSGSVGSRLSVVFTPKGKKYSNNNLFLIIGELEKDKTLIFTNSIFFCSLIAKF